MSKSLQHTSVLYDEAVASLDVVADGTYIDATYGRGGHTSNILQHLGERGRLLVFDRDAAAIAHANERWANDARVSIFHQAFSNLRNCIAGLDMVGKIDGVLFDLGVSSPQLDDPERGFSFNKDGPLDMRMDQTSGVSLAEWLLDIEEKELASVLWRYGEERHSRRIARAMKARQAEEPLTTTRQLAELVAELVPAREPGKHPATRTFQALRIAINGELDELEMVLPQSEEILAMHGRMVFISFHSLEDRLVKRYMQKAAKGDPFPPDLPVPQDVLQPTLKIIAKGVKPDNAEVQENRRARSAVLRAAEKIAQVAHV